MCGGTGPRWTEEEHEAAMTAKHQAAMEQAAERLAEEEKKCMKTFNSLFQKIRMKKMRKSPEERRRSSIRTKRHSAIPDQPIPLENLFYDRVSDEESW